ncbi:MAG TPA: primosomal protein N' [Pseudobacteroides sp.]|uniref:primosomal protein N' n=1 Tax=Pseudobacteroides sp. TaxID=1968840 RepID=UPI002F923F34
MNRIAFVILSDSSRDFDKEYTYLVPDSLMGEVFAGSRVIVPFGASNRNAEGFVMAVRDAEELDISYKLKYIKKVLDDIKWLDEWSINLSRWMRKRYVCTFHDALKCMLPPGVGVKSVKAVVLEKNIEHKNQTIQEIIDFIAENGGECGLDELSAHINKTTFSKYISQMEKEGFIAIKEEFINKAREKKIRVACLALPPKDIDEAINGNKIKNIQQIRVLEILKEAGCLSIADITKFSGATSSSINTLKKHGYIYYKEIEVSRDPYVGRYYARTEAFQPTKEQALVLKDALDKIQRREFYEVLLHGVTGSGKTEVYLQLIKACFDRGMSSIVLVPEISLTPQMVERFKSRFGDEVAVLHSRLSAGQRYDQWRLIRDGKKRVVVGARSAVFAPLKNLGIIILDEEHESSYKSETTPKYQARDIARQRCVMSNALLLYGSATPAVETYFRAVNGEIGLYKMLERPNNAVLPKVEIIDMRNELNEGNRSMFSNRLSQEIKKNIELGQQTILFLNRRGHSSFVICRSCGFTMKCPNCSINLTYHANNERLICHYCGFTVKNPAICPKCNSKNIRHFGTGTQKIEEEARKVFNESSVIRMDMDTTSAKDSHEKILTDFKEKNINIMIGTQMIAKGHDFPNVTLVGVLAADSMLNLGDFRASEKTFQLITQVAGRAGRGQLLGRVIIQSYNTEDFSILTACKHDYIGFYKHEIMIREKLGYPPFTNIGVVIISGPDDKAASSSAKEAGDAITGQMDSVGCKPEIYGPMRAPLAYIKNKYRWRIIIKCNEIDKIIDGFTKLRDIYYKKFEKSCVEMSMDINPFNML